MNAFSMPMTELATAFVTHGLHYNPLEPYMLASGKISPYYMDCRTVIAWPSICKKIQYAMYTKLHWLLHDIRPQAVGGMLTGAYPVASICGRAIAQHPWLREPQVFGIHKALKDHGVVNPFFGLNIAHCLQDGGKIILVDDVYTTGGSLWKAAQICIDAGLTVKAVFVLVHRDESPTLTFTCPDASEIPLEYLFTLPDLITFGHENHLLPEKE